VAGVTIVTTTIPAADRSGTKGALPVNAMYLPLALLMLAAETADMQPRLPLVATVERIPLLRSPGTVTLTAFPFNRRIELRAARDGTGLATKIAAAGSRICPRTLVDRNMVILQCATRRLDGALMIENGKVFLEIYELRGVPWRGDENRIDIFYNPLDFRLGDGCPGNTPVARGECAYRAGQYTSAAVEFRRALALDGRRVAAIRLGDMALRNQDPVAAAGWYQAAGRVGGFGRLAAVRLCELSGTCLGKQRSYVFDPSALPEPLHTEMLLRAARVAAYLGELPQAMTTLRQAIDSAHGGCDGSTLLFCRQMLLKVLEEPGKEGSVEALDTYLVLPGRLDGPLAFALVNAAARKAATLGAPIFAGNLMASSVPAVEKSAKGLLGEFLLRTVEFYLAGNDRTRARVIGEFADTSLGRAKMSGPRWNAVLKELEGTDAYLDGDTRTQASLGDGTRGSNGSTRARVLMGEATLDLTLAYTALARANSARLSAESTDDALAGSP